MKNLTQRLDKLRLIIQNEAFLRGKGLGNEGNIRIFCYEPQEEMTIRYFVEQLAEDKSLHCKLHIYNLYQVFLQICEEKKIIKSVDKMEFSKGSEHLLQRLQSIANIRAFTERIAYEPQQVGDVVLITGVGEVYPFMRAHILMEALQSVFNAVPVVVMYPGVYDGGYVKMFNCLESNPYYRAYKIL